MSEEVWKTVQADEKYEVSNLGNVRRIGRKKIRKLKLINTGYPTVGLSTKGVCKTYTVHRLVCIAFHGSPPEGLVVNHKDGDKLNNTASNLEWLSHSGNNIHALATGLRKNPDTRGERNGRAVITLAIAREIIENPLRLKGVELAQKHGVSPQLVSAVKRRKSWPELSPVSQSAAKRQTKIPLAPRALFKPADDRNV